ncbi:hypothetical protein [Streptomyces albicerus]|uniref:hypothetical protein n=1 Tax=Streptomyces albicerus TaxID=2569859 RepID=UPI00124B47D7
MESLVVPARFNGPARSANGGYFCGLVAEAASPELHGPVAVSLHAPPPLDVSLGVATTGRRAHVWDGTALVATASPTRYAAAPLLSATPAVARDAADRFAGHRHHPFPSCFVCGPARTAPDGLRLAPGPVPGEAGRVACPWTPDASLPLRAGRIAPEIIWSVLDCPAGWTTGAADVTRVLGWMHADVLDLPSVGEPCVVTARLDRRDQRTTTNTTVLHSEERGLLARATTRWVVWPTAPGGPRDLAAGPGPGGVTR